MELKQHCVIAHIQALPGNGDRVAVRVSELAFHVRQEPGSVFFLPYRESRDPDRFSVVEVYRDQAAFEQHGSQDYVQRFNDALKELAVGGASSVTAYDEVAPSPQRRSPVRGLDHVGLTVPDMETATRFFQAAFDAVVLYDVLPAGVPPQQGPTVEQQLGLPHGACLRRLRLMRIGASGSFELFETGNADPAVPVSLIGMGLTHFALYVDDLGEAVRRFQAAGGTLLSAPHSLAAQEKAPHNAGVYGRAPWGSLIELLTYPDGIAYPDHPVAYRWTPAARPAIEEVAL